MSRPVKRETEGFLHHAWTDRPAWHGGLLALALLVLSACTLRPGTEALTPLPEAPAGAEVVRVYVVTTRAPMEAPGIGYTAIPSLSTGYRYYDLSVPSNPRDKGPFWSDGSPDPERDFLVVGTGALDRDSFLARMREEVRQAGGGDPTVFVHGYNVSFQEGLLQLARLSAQSQVRLPPVLFSWPSKARALEYVADRQEALASRDALAGLLSDLEPLPGETFLAAHSMGGWITMEAMRSLGLRQERRVLDDLDVVLIAPDIDILVFRQQLLAISPFKRPIAVLVAKDDKALALSSMISTHRPRLGALDVENPVVARAAEAAQVQLIDISQIPAESALRHSRYLRLAQMYSAMQTGEGAVDVFRMAGGFVFDTLGTGLIQVGATLAPN